MSKKMNRVEVSNPFVGITCMQVCCHKKATKKEILAVANSENPCGTSKGWCKVISTKKDCKDLAVKENCLPVQCEDHKNRVHKLVIC